MNEGVNAQQIRRGINYLYLLYFCPPQKLQSFQEPAQVFMRKTEKMTDRKGISILDVFSAACSRVIEFHTHSREAEEEMLSVLMGAAIPALESEDHLVKFQKEMETIRGLSPRAELKNRLHRNKGCALCERPCRYGYFSLISDPSFVKLLDQLQAESIKNPSEKNVVRAIWTFTIKHLWETIECNQAFISADHLGNLSYCLLLLATAKSRFAFPEKEMHILQESNQLSILNYQENYQR